MKLAVAAGLCLFLCSPAANADRKGAIALKKQGDLLLSRGDTALGVKAYKRALRADRRYGPAWGALAMHYLRTRNYAAAESLLGQCVEVLPKYPEGWYHLAYARRKRGKHDAAIAAYRRYAKLRPKSADPHYGIGLALRAKKRYSEAAKAFRRYALLESSPKRRSWVDKALKLAVEAEGLARRARKAPKAAKVAKATKNGSATKVKSPPRYALVPVARGEAPKKSAAPDAKPATAERKRAQPHKLRGDRHAEKGRYEAAAVAYRKAIAIDYTYTAAFNELGSVLFALKRYNDAIKTFRVAIRDNPDYHLGWYNLAYALRKARRNREAIAAYKKFAAQNPKDPDPHYGIALAHQALNDKSSAIASFNRYIALEGRATHRAWIAKASAAVRKLGGTPAKAGSAAKPISGGAALAAAGGAKAGGGGAAKAGSGGAKAAPLPPDVLAKALGKAVGKAPKAKKLSAKERRRLARLERKRKRAEARRKRAEARAAKREMARLARAERKRKRAEARRKRAEARAAKREKARLARAARKRKRAEARRKRAEARRKRAEARAAKREMARLARAERKRKRAAARAAKRGEAKGKGKAAAAKAAPVAVAVAAKVPMAKPTAKPMPDKPATIAPPPKPMGSGSSTADKLRVQGDSLARVGKCAQALPLYRRALKADPFATKAYHGVAYCSQRLRRYDAGIRMLRIGLRDNPGYVAGYLHLARLRDTKGAHTAAVGSYRKYLRKRPKDNIARFELARALRHGGHKPQAISAYQDYLRREQRKEAERHRAAAYAELLALGGAAPLVAGVAVAATGSAGKAVKPDPFASALSAAKGTTKPKKLSRAERRRLARARAAEDRRMRKEARLAKLRAKREARKQARAERRRKAKERREARKRARAERLRKRKEARLAKLQARRDARRRRAERRREDRMLARLAKKGGKKRGKRSRRGKAPLAAGTGLARRLSDDLDGLGKRPVAPKVELFDQLKPAPDAARGLVAVADKQFAKRRYIVALGIYRQAAQLDSNASEPLYKAGVAAVAVGRMHLAAELFERVLQIDPGNATARTSLRLARTAAKGKKPSAAFLSSALSRAKADIGAGRYARAARLLTKLERQVASAQVYRLRAAARLGLRQSRGAVRDAGRSLALAPTEADALRLLGDAQRQLGKQRKALYYYRLFLTRTAGDAAAAGARKAVQSAIAELSASKA